MEKILVSKCLLGEACRYDGKSVPCDAVIALKERFILIPVCPEQLGGLPTPRIPAEIIGERVCRADSVDVTEEYIRGACESLKIALDNGCRIAVLKSRSPSCGKGSVYDGSFTRTLTVGDGICAKLLKDHGIKIYDESETDDIK